ncbi:phage tail protein [Candidatus Poribacteria bacterium]|nr:phage tail protein [Candidatus Poribacteria bacterium]
MAQGERNDPYRNFRYRLEIDGIQQAGFSDASGFDTTVDVVEYREGNETPTVRKLSGLTKYGNLTLKWGITDSSMELYKWHRAGFLGKVERKNISVIVLDEEGSDVARWNFIQAWPTKYTPPTLTAKGNEVAIETLEIVHEGMERVAP